MKNIYVICLLICGLVACSNFNSEEDRLLVSVYDKELYLSDIKHILSEESSIEDSVFYINAWIEKWVKEQLLVHQAHLNLKENTTHIESQIENYRNSLLIFAYLKELVAQKMDTSVFEYEIKDYYKENKYNFELKDHIVRMIYIKVNHDVPNLSQLKKLYKSNKEEDFLRLEEYCFKFADEFSLDDTTWVYFDDILDKLPIQSDNHSEYLKRNQFIELEDSSGLYFVRFKKYKIKDSISPLDLERKRIKNIILNKRKIDFLKSIEQDLYQNALTKGKIQYENN